MNTSVYIDGFNLYYGCLRHSPNKWLDLSKLCSKLLPGHTITQINYYTAYVSALPHDPDQPVRQQTYIRALRTLPNVKVIEGNFLIHRVWLPRTSGPTGTAPLYTAAGRLDCVEVIKVEEKGSDVNLATHLLYDAFKNNFDIAVVVSNDSDLLEPIKIVRNELGKQVGILNPHRRPSRALLPHIDFIKQIRQGALAASQFPPVLTDVTGTFHKPAAW